MNSTQTDREAAIRDFLIDAEWGDAHRESLGEDASTRSYERLSLGSETAILMNAPPAAEGRICGRDASVTERVLAGWNGRSRLAACRVDAFVGIAQHLERLGLASPHIIAFDVEQGLCLLEDLGEGIYARELEKGADELQLYTAAVEALAHVHRAPVPDSVMAVDYEWPILPFDTLALTTGADLFPKWYPNFDERVRFKGAIARDFADLVSDHSEHLASLPKVFMLRDYHAENLLWLPDRSGLQRVGILDFQDAVAGPAAWDLAMFLQDARRDVSPDIQEATLHRYLDLTGHDDQTFRKDYAIAGAINALRIIGVFARLISRDGKPRYRDFLPREWGHLNDNLKNPVLADLRRILETAAPDMIEPI